MPVKPPGCSVFPTSKMEAGGPPIAILSTGTAVRQKPGGALIPIGSRFCVEIVAPYAGWVYRDLI